MTMREDFEKWFISEGGKEEHLKMCGDDGYWSMMVYPEWVTWKAAYIAGQKAMLELAAKECGKVKKDSYRYDAMTADECACGICSMTIECE